MQLEVLSQLSVCSPFFIAELGLIMPTEFVLKNKWLELIDSLEYITY